MPQSWMRNWLAIASHLSDWPAFHYDVQEGDIASDGIGTGANRLRVDGGRIYDSARNAADLSHAQVLADPDHKAATYPEG